MKTFITMALMWLVASQGVLEADTSKSSFLIKGTSTVHDWESTITDYTVRGRFTGELITDLEVVVQANSIESGKSIMDDKTYDALQVEAYPAIVFQAKELHLTNGQVQGVGTLQLVGKSKDMTIHAQGKTLPNGAVSVSGTVDMVMSDFGIEPPTAMFGTLTTGDQVTIEFNFILN